MGIVKEFREFAVKGNMIDMAVGLVVGAAFTGVVTSLVADIVMPPFGLVLGNKPFDSLALTLQAANESTKTPAVVISYGKFITALLNFTIVSFTIFMVVKQINRFKRAPVPPPPATRECPECLSAIPLKARRCPCCTSQVEPV